MSPTRAAHPSSNAVRSEAPAGSMRLATSGSTIAAPTRSRGSTDTRGAWKTSCTRWRSSRPQRTPQALTRSPSTVTEPLSGASSIAMTCASVLLPAPLGPTSPSRVPHGSESDARSSATTRPLPPR